MLQPTTFLLGTFALLPFAPPGLAQESDLADTIVGCKEVSCPTPYCELGGDSFNEIGLARIPDVPTALEGLSLVKGVEAGNMNLTEGAEGGNRAFKSLYYLGTPPDLDIGGLTGCAVIFHDAAGQFEDAHRYVMSAQGTCSDAFDETCMDALGGRALGIQGGCQALRSELQKKTIDACADLAGTGKGLGRFTVESFSDISPVTESENSTSNCWPIIPKVDNLSMIANDTVMDDNYAGAIYDQMYKVTPVLTVFFGNQGNTSSLVDETWSQMTCLKVVRIEEPPPSGSENSVSICEPNVLLTAGLLTILGALL